ncbi:MAG: O-phosphoserine--tRNA ligase [Candidatus Syntrophoarchaeum sp.]|nr:O-phosphoserine--tRNA ligase [Candidatus Syntrophoarchaeum sp.]
MKFDPKQIREETSKDFEATWMAGAKYASERSLNEKYPRSLLRLRCGKPHPVFETIQKLRDAYLRLGFEEVMNPVIIEEAEVKKQFGKEALAVLDRCYYLAGLPRPDIGISEDSVKRMNSYFGKELSKEEIEALRNTLHRYKKGEIDGDDLVYEVANSMDVADIEVAKVFDAVFPELKNLSPVPSGSTLRSHMTSGWFLTLAEVWNKRPLPIKQFSVDRCFRREQREGEIRLRNYHSASCVLCNEEVSIDDGKDIATGLLSQFGFDKIKFRKDEKRSKYYMPETQTEVFCYHPRIGWVEVATFGIYSPTALAQYDIPYPVMNLGLGVERLAMILHDASDVRALTFPQFYAQWELSDMEIAGMVNMEETPGTAEGDEIAKNIVRVCEEKGSAKSPCEFLAYRGPLLGRDVEVWVTEPEENTLLCGPAYLNEMVVHEGSIFGIPRKKEWETTFEAGVPTDIRFLDAFAAFAARRIEEAAKIGEMDQKDCEVKARIVRSGADINVKIDEVVMRYVTSRKKKIDIRGPVFITVVGKKSL